MSFNRRGPDRPDRSDRSDRSDRDRPGRDRFDRPPQRGGNWQPRGDRPQGGRPFDRRPRPDRGVADEGGMSIRLDPRRLGTLKRLAAETGTRPGELVRLWVEERIDAERSGDAPAGPGGGLTARLDELAARVAALEARNGGEPQPVATTAGEDETAPPTDVETRAAPQPESDARPTATRRPRSASAKPSGPRVGLHDEMIAVIAERGPMSAADLAQAISERGRYVPPRSGKALDAAMVSQRVSNPVYRSRFRRADGRIGLAEEN